MDRKYKECFEFMMDTKYLCIFPLLTYWWEGGGPEIFVLQLLYSKNDVF